MGQQIGRTHLLDELRIQLPSPSFGKTFRFDKDGSSEKFSGKLRKISPETTTIAWQNRMGVNPRIVKTGKSRIVTKSLVRIRAGKHSSGYFSGPRP